MNALRIGRYDIATHMTKVAITLLLTGWWLFGPMIGYGGCDTDATYHEGINGTIWEHLLWPLSHVNVWHLLANLWVLWYISKPLKVWEGYVIAVVCSWLPVWGLWEIGATCGFSGVLCGMIGVKWGEWCWSRQSMTAYTTFLKRVLPFVAVGIVIPHVNWCIHLYCVIVGLAYGVMAGACQGKQQA
ncbi:MAG: rhomboid family intramembrane serine protease [Prevotella sp.]|nr:rhomboid family intramembrane serine protease [Prevotella sp.]